MKSSPLLMALFMMVMDFSSAQTSSASTKPVVVKPSNAAKTVIALPPGVEPIQFQAADVTFKGKVTRTVKLELALDDAQQSRGLMYRPALEKNSGMLFLNSRMQSGAFWMKNTLISLDIAYFDATGKINDILQMMPCAADPCPSYPPKAPYIGAVEMNLGWFKKAGIKVGDTVSFRLKF